MKQEEINTNDYLKGIVLNLPESPGIYQYLNAEGTIIYVGKAKNLKRREMGKLIWELDFFFLLHV